MGFVSEVAAGLPGLYATPVIKPVIRTEAENLSRLADAFNQAALAHVCVDVQDLYFDPEHPGMKEGLAYSANPKNRIAMAAALAGNIRDFTEAVRGHIPTFWVAHESPHAYDENPQLWGLPFEQRKEAMRRKLFMQAPAPEDPFVLKGGFNAFFNTDLEEKLRQRKIAAVLLTGVYLHCCIEESAIGGLSRNFDVFVVDTLASSLDFHQVIVDTSIQNMKRSGVCFITPENVLNLAHGPA